MEVIQARIASFKKTKRAKNPEKPTTTVTLKWPHPAEFRANPVTLAEAGFYYDPSYDDPDNVTCYICEKELGGWEEGDDPFVIHWDKCGQSCCWASVRCKLMSDVDQSGRFISSDRTRLPTHKSMEQARLETFKVGKGWIHDKTKDHKANSKMMARAGFVYTPQHSGDDLAACLYCNTSLSGWDDDDDPLEEHRKRADRSDFPCLFFAASSAEGSKTESKSRPSKSASKTQSKPPSRSTSKSKHQDVLLPTKAFEAEDEEVESTNAGSSTAKTPRNPRTTSSTSTRESSTKTPRGKTRSSSRSGLKNVAEEEEEEDKGDANAALVPPPTVKKKGRVRSKSVAKTDIPPEEDGEEAQQDPPPTIKKKSRSQSKSIQQVVTQSEDDENHPEPPPTIKKKKVQSQSKSVVGSGVRTGETDEDTPLEPPPTVKKKSRSNSKSVARSEVPTEAEARDDIAESRKPTRSKADKVASETEEAPQRKPSRTQSRTLIAPSDTEDSGARKPSRTRSKPKATESLQEQPKSTAKPKHQRTASKSKTRAPIPVSEPDSEPEPEPDTSTTAVPKNVATTTRSPKTVGNHDTGFDISTPSPPSPSPAPKNDVMADLPPLFVPKRKVAAKIPSLPEEETLKKPSKTEPKPSLQAPEHSRDAKGPSSSYSDIFTPVAPISRSPPQLSTKEKVFSKSIPSSKGSIKEKMKVVEISSDEEADEVVLELEADTTSKNFPQQPKTMPIPAASSSRPQFDHQPAKLISESKRGKKPILVEVVQPPESPQPVTPTRSPSLLPPVGLVDGDVSMDDIEPETDAQMVDNDPAPSTPPRPAAPPSWGANNFAQQSSHMAGTESDPSIGPAEPPVIPALSKLPFTPLHSLSEEELDMTVEEWIRYQMEVEFDKFRRDGERELQRFRKRAEDVRKVIEGL